MRESYIITESRASLAEYPNYKRALDVAADEVRASGRGQLVWKLVATVSAGLPVVTEHE